MTGSKTGHRVIVGWDTTKEEDYAYEFLIATSRFLTHKYFVVGDALASKATCASDPVWGIATINTKPSDFNWRCAHECESSEEGGIGTKYICASQQVEHGDVKLLVDAGTARRIQEWVQDTLDICKMR